MKEDLVEILEAGLAAADPAAAVLHTLRVEDGRLCAEDISFEPRRILVVAAGKAAGAMAHAAEELLGDRISGGLVVTKDGHEAPVENLEVIYASHPEPDKRGVEATWRVVELAESLEEGDLLLALVSGGASALLADPVPPIEVEDLTRLTSDLLKSGADIEEINSVRKHVSVLKGGGLVKLAHPASTLALVLSDVVGDNSSSIASGLTAPDPTTLGDARKVLERYGIEAPETVAAYLREAEETPKPGDAVFEKANTIICGGGRPTAVAAAHKAKDLGYTPLILSTRLTGEACSTAGLYAAIIREILESGNPVPAPCALVSGGEVTVTVRGDGVGGPNQEFALALALNLEEVEGWATFSVDTDGNDGPTDAAGGLVSGATATAIREKGIVPEEALRNNDAYAALGAGGALLVTGPTGTNVNDLRVTLVRRGSQ